MSTPRSLDEARAAFPGCSFFMSTGPDLPVALDVVDEADATHSYLGETELACWQQAFPAPPAEAVPIPVRPPAGKARDEQDAVPPAPPPVGLFD